MHNHPPHNPSLRRCLAGGLLWTLALLGAAHAAEHRFTLAAQSDWGKNLGFNLGFEARNAAGPCTIADLALVFYAGDGSQFYYTFKRNGWRAGQDYTIRAEITPGQIALWVNGQLAEQTAARFQPLPGDLKVNWVSGEYAGPANYIVVPIFLRISENGKNLLNYTFDSGKRPAPDVFAIPYLPADTRIVPFTLAAGRPCVIEASLRIIDITRLADFAPYFDRFGQWRHHDWPGKIKTEADLKQRRAAEEKQLAAWAPSPDYDRYGGYRRAGWQERATGFFRVVQRQGFFWLVTPEGNPCFYTGVCGIGLDADWWPPTAISGRERFFEWLPPATGEFAAARTPGAWGAKDIDFWAPVTANLIRKFGPTWRADANRNAFRRLQAWGFSGGGKWARQNPAPITFPWMPVLGRGDTPNLVNRPDVFDPGVRDIFARELRKQVAGLRDNPWILGLSYGNEDAEMIFTDEIQKVMQLDGTPPAKCATDRPSARHHLSRRPCRPRQGLETAAGRGLPRPPASTPPKTPSFPDADIEIMRLHYLDHYHAFVYQTLKAADPNHLYFGSWLPGWRAIWTHPQDWNVFARHCDVLGYDHYDYAFARPELRAILKNTRKPVLCGEFGWAPSYGGTRGFAWEMKHGDIRTDADAGRALPPMGSPMPPPPPTASAASISCNTTNRPPAKPPAAAPQLRFGEGLAWGLVDITDTPKWEMVRQVRDANLKCRPRPVSPPWPENPPPDPALEKPNQLTNNKLKNHNSTRIACESMPWSAVRITALALGAGSAPAQTWPRQRIGGSAANQGGIPCRTPWRMARLNPITKPNVGRQRRPPLRTEP